MLPFVIFLSYIIGGWILGENVSDLHYGAGIDFKWIRENLVQYLAGSLVLAVSLAGIFGPLSYLLLYYFRKQNG